MILRPRALRHAKPTRRQDSNYVKQSAWQILETPITYTISQAPLSKASRTSHLNDLNPRPTLTAIPSRAQASSINQRPSRHNGGQRRTIDASHPLDSSRYLHTHAAASRSHIASRVRTSFKLALTARAGRDPKCSLSKSSAAKQAKPT
jgi:hypothetical protein